MVRPRRGCRGRFVPKHVWQNGAVQLVESAPCAREIGALALFPAREVERGNTVPNGPFWSVRVSGPERWKVGAEKVEGKWGQGLTDKTLCCIVGGCY